MVKKKLLYDETQEEQTQTQVEEKPPSKPKNALEFLSFRETDPSRALIDEEKENIYVENPVQ